LREDVSALLYKALQRIASRVEYKGNGIPLVVFNGLNWKRDDPVNFRITFENGKANGINLFDAERKTVNCQLIK